MNYDIVVIGGGIHGCAAAAHAANSGLKVLLIEKDDLAAHTSSASSKLIHGGLRYLEHGEFHLVSEALQARHALLNQAPHLVKPLAFVLPHTKMNRPKWQIQLGLKLYDFLSRKDSLASPSKIKRAHSSPFFSPLHASIQEGFLYYDAKTDDARLTIENALLAKAQGAHIQTHTTLTQAVTTAEHWHLTLTPQNGLPYEVTARALINTTGPWVNVIQQQLKVPTFPDLTLVKGSHLVLPRLYHGEHAYILEHPDKRVIFCIPYHGHTLVGTTECSYTDATFPPQVDEAEIAYLNELLQRYFYPDHLSKKVLSHWSGVRTLLAKPEASFSHLSRNTSVFLSQKPLPVVSLYGGKLTTHQHTAKQLLQALSPFFQVLRSSSIEKRPFPGAVCSSSTSFENEINQLKKTYHWLPDTQLHRYINQYGTRTSQLLASCKTIKDLGTLIGKTLYAKEIDFLCEHEWATSSDDILWRRTKLGLCFDENEKINLQGYMDNSKRLSL